MIFFLFIIDMFIIYLLFVIICYLYKNVIFFKFSKYVSVTCIFDHSIQILLYRKWQQKYFFKANYHESSDNLTHSYYKAPRQILGSFVHLRILAISHCDIAVSHLISSSLLPRSVPPHPNSTTSSFLTRGSRLVSSRLLVISRSQRPRAVLSFRKVKTNLRRFHPIRATRASSTVVQIKQYD